MANLLQPRIIETTTVRSGGSADESSSEHVTERVFRIEESDSLWIGLNGISLERGKFGSDRDVLRIDSYSGTILADALIENLRIQASLAKDEARLLQRALEVFQNQQAEDLEIMAGTDTAKRLQEQLATAYCLQRRVLKTACQVL